MMKEFVLKSESKFERIEKLLQRIAGMQASGEGFYNAGLFACQRTHSFLPYQREDNNIFYTLLIVFTLQRLQNRLPVDLQILCEEIIGKAQANYSNYQNKYGLKTYNFYQTFPPQYFPNGWFSRFSHFELPDDLDDTAFVYLTTQPSQEELLWLKKKMGLHANLSRKRIRNTFKEYRQLKAYSIWFGKNMPLEFDVCVLCNILELVFTYQFPLNVHDQDSLKLLRTIIEQKKYFTHAFYISPNYPTAGLILYHLSRLIHNHPQTGLHDLVPELQKDLQQAFSSSSCPVEKTMLGTAMIRSGLPAPEVDCPLDHPRIKRFWFFRASLLKPLDNFPLGKPSRYSLFHLKWKCEAFNLALLLEFEVLKTLP
jgi:hypothetical protein